MKALIKPLDRETPRVSGTTSSKNIFLINLDSSPVSFAAYIAAPAATASSGLTEKFKVLPSKKFWIIVLTLGIRVDPPTIMIS
jgi:hypothetical protein